MAWNQGSARFVSPGARRSAPRLRKRLTEAEKRLWWQLRNRLPLSGTHFRRQVAVGPYVTDFCCYEHRLVVEVDGNQHGLEAARALDGRRDSFLAATGFRVLRFSNHQVTHEIDIVLDTILAALGERVQTPDASPAIGGVAEPSHA